MTSTLFIFLLIPVSAILAGGLLKTFFPVGDKIRNTIMLFAAGVVFSVVAVEILPDVIKYHHPFNSITGFTLGLISMLLIKSAQQKMEAAGHITKNEHLGLPWPLLAGFMIDVFVDGWLTGIGFSAGASEGKLLSIALSVEAFTLAIAAITLLQTKAISKRQGIVATVILLGIFLISSVSGSLLLNFLSKSVMEGFLSFGLSALLFLVTEQLLIEAHDNKESPWQTSAFFIGFLIFMILGMYE